MTELFYEFSCGCKIPQKEEGIKEYDGLPKLEMDFFNLPMNCQATWNLLGTGRTRGVFQLDSNLGRGYAKKLAPDSLEELAALTSLLRPGCMQYIVEGKSMTDHFVERKHGREKVTYPDDRLAKYLDETYGVLTYQEQMIQIAGELAGFDGNLRNKLRKSVGKKDVALLYSLREKFINGAIEHGLTSEASNLIFDNIEKAGRYSFNRSHAYEYGLVSYITAYAKAHFPLHFFCASLKYVKDMDGLRELMSETTLFDIVVLPPSIDNQSNKFTIKDGAIQYGWNEVKGTSKNAVEKLINEVIEIEKELGREAKDFTWYEFLVLLSHKVEKDTVNNLILCGFLDNTGVSRKEQLHQFHLFLKLSNGERAWIAQFWRDYEDVTSLLSALVESKSCQKNRKKTVFALISALQNAGKSLQDNVDFVCDAETELLGVAVTQSKTAKKEHYANIKVSDFLVGAGAKNMNFVVEVNDVDERAIKSGVNLGKKMAYVRLSDRSGEMECTFFSREWEEMRSEIVKGNVVLLTGSRHKDMSLKVENVRVI